MHPGLTHAAYSAWTINVSLMLQYNHPYVDSTTVLSDSNMSRSCTNAELLLYHNWTIIWLDFHDIQSVLSNALYNYLHDLNGAEASQEGN